MTVFVSRGSHIIFIAELVLSWDSLTLTIALSLAVDTWLCEEIPESRGNDIKYFDRDRLH